MTTKELVAVPPDRFVKFVNLDVGDICRNEEGKYFIKIESINGCVSATNSTFNAVNLITGAVVWFSDYDEVILAQSIKFSIVL